MSIIRGGSSGYTIVEVMIFLTVASAMFVSAISIFTRYQRTTQFNQSVKQFESELRDVVNDVATGVYPELNGIRCRDSGGSITFEVSAAAATGQNNECVLIGKAIQFGETPVTDSSLEIPDIEPDSGYSLYTIIALNDSTSQGFGQSGDTQVLRNIVAPEFDTVEDFSIQWETGVTSAYIKKRTESDISFVRGLVVVFDTFNDPNTVTSPSGGDTFASGGSATAMYALVDPTTDEFSITSSRLADNQFISQLDHSTLFAPSSPLVRLGGADIEEPLTVCLSNGDEFAAVRLDGQTVESLLEPPVRCLP
ncbi:MAG: hypothetical protein AAF413_03825 [Patescibacteria group bacterium]